MHIGVQGIELFYMGVTLLYRGKNAYDRWGAQGIMRLSDLKKGEGNIGNWFFIWIVL